MYFGNNFNCINSWSVSQTPSLLSVQSGVHERGEEGGKGVYQGPKVGPKMRKMAKTNRNEEKHHNKWILG